MDTIQTSGPPRGSSEFLHRRHLDESFNEQPSTNNDSLEFARLLPESVPILDERIQAQSWLLVLFTAPIIVALLVWFLVLLRRRLNMIQHNLVNGGAYFRSKAPILQQTNRTRKGLTRSNGHYLLESSSSPSETSTTSSSSTSSSAQAPKHLDNCCSSPSLANPTTSNLSTCRRAKDEFLRPIVDHMHVYLVTITYQEIISCLVAFTIAILNIVRFRNLFCCNLVIFVLITTRLLSLFTLTTFTLGKLIRLFHLKPLVIRNHPPQNSHLVISRSKAQVAQDSEQRISTNDVNSNKRQVAVTTRATPSTVATKTTTAKQTSSSDSNEQKHPDSIKHQTVAASKGKIKRCNSPYDANATISRLIIKDEAHSRANKLDDGSCSPTVSGEEDLSYHMRQYTSLGGETDCDPRGIKQVIDQRRRQGEPIASKLLVLSLISASSALICLYLRLVPQSGPLLYTGTDLQQPLVIHDNRISDNNRSKSDWTIPIYTPTTTTEASTRYSSDDRSQQPNYQASWSSRFQQSSQLKLLIDQYELQNFIHLLLDTHLQTSRFSCTLAAGNYAPIAKYSILILYATLMIAITALSLAIRQVGKRKLRLLELQQSPLLLFGASASSVVPQFPQKILQTGVDFSSLDFREKGQTDSNRKRYSELLKHNIIRQHHQSSLEMSRCSGSNRRSTSNNLHQQCHQHTGSNNNRLAHCKRMRSSSMSSLLLPASQLGLSTSVERCPSQPSSQLKGGKYLLTGRQTSGNPRRLAGAQSLANLASSHPNQAAASAHLHLHRQFPKWIQSGKLTNSSGHLAWLPLGSAATVASLSNIGRGSLSSQSAQGASGKTAKRRVVSRPSCRRDLCSIGEHLVQATSATTAANSNGCLTLEEREGRQRFATLDEQSELAQRQVTEVATHSTGGQQRQQQQRKLYSDHKQALRSQLNYVELRRDLRLSQTVILFGQLLNHAPILLLLLLAILIPEGLVSGWNSSHDNGFIWLMLIEALIVPILLCALDSRLRGALKQSLKCSNSSKASKILIGSPYGYNQARLNVHNKATSSLHLGANSIATCHLNVASRQPGAASDLVLGPSSAFPDFMFVCPARSQIASRYQQLGACHALTGPPYPLPGNTRPEQPLTIDTEDSFRANFSLVTKEPIGCGGFRAVDSLAVTGHRRVKSYCEKDACKQPRRRRRRGSASAAILSATRRLLRFGRSNRLKARRARHISSGYLVANTTSTTDSNNTAGSCSGKRAPVSCKQRRSRSEGVIGSSLSPTSSLSTLIRKFNHDNYTSVCQQYNEQRKQQLEGAKQEVLIDGLDGPVKGEMDMDVEQSDNLLDVDGIYCRRGGLYYNYSLEEPRKVGNKARVNPLLSAEKRDGQQVGSISIERSTKTTEPDEVELSSTFSNLVQNGSNANRSEVEPSLESSSAPLVKESSPSSVSKKKGKDRNNEPMISNITSIQELLDKMNGMMGKEMNAVEDCGQVEMFVDEKFSKGSNVLDNERQSLRNSGRNNKCILEMITAENNRGKNGSGKSNKQVDCCANQLRQLTTAIGNCEPLGLNRGDCNTIGYTTGTIDYASLRSVDDALSLVSVSSEFEYHNINHGHQQQSSVLAPTSSSAVTESTTTLCSDESVPGGDRCKMAQMNRRHSIKQGMSPLEFTFIDRKEDYEPTGRKPALESVDLNRSATQLNSVSTSDIKRLEDIRFPSFLPTKQQAEESSRALGAVSKALPMIGGRNSGKLRLATSPKLQSAQQVSPLNHSSSNSSSSSSASGKTTSSLLNLTTAKFAALNGQQDDRQERKQQQTKLRENVGNTITKQKASRIVTLTEFGSRNQLVNRGNQETEERSLPAQSGNVRARIRKMEQQSVPDLHTSHHQQPEKSRQGAIISMIPVTSNSKLNQTSSSGSSSVTRSNVSTSQSRLQQQKPTNFSLNSQHHDYQKSSKAYGRRNQSGGRY